MQKEKIQTVIDRLPDDVDVDSLVEKLYLLRRIEVAEQEIAGGKGISHQDALKRLSKWLD